LAEADRSSTRNNDLLCDLTANMGISNNADNATTNIWQTLHICLVLVQKNEKGF